MTEIARMYGGSLYDLAAEEGLETRILEELDAVADILKQDPEYLHLLSIPSIPKKERCALLDEAFRGKVHLYVLNFVKILCEKGTLRELPGCARAFRVKYNQAHGILEATAVTAVPMSADQTARLHEKHRQNDRPQDQSGCSRSGRHPAGHRGHRAGRHGQKPAGQPAPQHCRHYRLIRPKILNKRIEW